MKRSILILLLISIAVFSGIAAVDKTAHVDQKAQIKEYTKAINKDQAFDIADLPLQFIKNEGQVNDKAGFYAKASRYTLWLTKEALVFDSYMKVQTLKETDPARNHGVMKRDFSRMVFVGANRNPGIVAGKVSKTKVNFIKGNDPSKWTSASMSEVVQYNELYSGIDMKVYGIEKSIEYDWIVKAGADPDQIKFKYEKVKSTHIDKEGNLRITTAFGDLVHKRPVSFQEIDGKRIPVDVTYKSLGKNRYGFNVPEYNNKHTLIIDPIVLPYSTYVGGSNRDGSDEIKVDSSGYVYVLGSTYSTDFPTLNQYMTDPGDSRWDLIAMKIDPGQSGAGSLLYSSYIGGNDTDSTGGMAIDNSGNMYIVGKTRSTDFPTVNQYMVDPGDADYDGFIFKLDPSRSGASSLLYSSYIGGDSEDEMRGVTVSSSGYVYISGDTESTDFPVLNPYMNTHNGGGGDGYITIMDTSKSGTDSLLFSTFIGGSGNDYPFSIDTDGLGNIYICGETASTNYPVNNQYMADPGDSDYDFMISHMQLSKPVVTTSTPSGITANSAEAGGEVTENNGFSVTERGLCWSTSNNPTTADDSVVLGQGVGIFAGNITSLIANTTYYVRAYATNHLGTGYGNEVSFTTGAASQATISTDAVYNITTTTADGGGNVTDNGGAPVTARGICWSTSINPTTADSTQAAGSGDGTFGASMSGLTESTTYYVRAYATNSEGTSYGSQVSFTTATPGTVALPTVTTDAASSIGNNSANSGGNVTADGGATVTARGICWGTSGYPTLANSSVTSGSGTGSFTASLSNLTTNTVYYARAYATNSAGTAYGNQISFKTTGSVVVTSKLPTVTTNAASQIMGTSVYLGGNITSQGSSAVMMRGVCWNTTGNPRVNSNMKVIGSGTGGFGATIEGLEKNTRYYARAYAINSEGIGYGRQIAFTTTDKELIHISGAVYTADGTPLSGVQISSSSGSSTTTGSDGRYLIAFTDTWSGTITPSKSGYSFSPGSKSYTDLMESRFNQNFVAGKDGQMIFSVTREINRTWLMSREYASISFKVGQYQAGKPGFFYIYRKEAGGVYKAVKVIAGAEITGDSHSFNDDTIKKDQAYSYILMVMDENNQLLEQSTEKTI